MKRLILVYNRRSSNFWRVEKEVLTKVRNLKGWAVGKFEVADTNVDDNSARLAKILSDGDLVMAAGGDATATIAINGIMSSKAQKVRVGVLAYGNFNDTARCFGDLKFEEILKGDTQEVWPLECSVNRTHWRYGMCYFTVGMFAEACAVFDHPKTRKHLQKKRKKHMTFSLAVLAQWWVRQRRRKFLPSFTLGNSSEEFVDSKGASDYMAVNGISVAKMMKGGKWFLQDGYFLSTTGVLTKFFRLVGFMLRSIFRRIPGVESDYDQIIFKRPAKVMLQAEGEYMKLNDVELIEVRKAKKPILAIMK